MNKIKNVFHRSQKIKSIEERRPQQFVKRQSSQATAAKRDEPTSSPAIDFMELSEMEKPAYSSWWKDLDPFDLERIDNQTVLKFLNGCHLEDSKLEQILALFETAGDGLTKVQFFAMLRLIAHAQNGRNISPALVYLGAPVPHFHTNAIDAIIKASSSSSTPTNNTQHNNNNNDISTPLPHNNNNIIKGDRKSWWGGYERQPQQSHFDHRRSFMGPTSFLSPQTPIPVQTPLLYHQPQQQQQQQNMGDTMDYFYPNPSSSVFSPVPPKLNNNNNNNNTSLCETIPENHIDKVHTHGRSRSAGNASDLIQDFDQEALQSSKSSLSLADMADTGQSLLLTQKFVYQSPSLRNRESINNPFNTMAVVDDGDNPFTDKNSKPNLGDVLPPPVPSQLTKPSFPKYTRTNNYVLKRSQSTGLKKEIMVKHQRHKSTGNTNAIIDF
ncbi:hypothetical protein K501DRAFT_285980 [Backusella circina FSU 941]|nr:hypothetical protein K501DRAFT_285980 [Backusella circina FSU 941]